MALYTPYTWVERLTAVGPTRMNAIETGLSDASQHHTFGTFAAMPAASAAYVNWLYFALDQSVCYECQLVGGAYYWVPLGPRGQAGQDTMQPGIIGASDLQCSTTAHNVLDIAVHSGTLWALNASGLLQRAVAGAIANLTLANADATKPRVDRIGAILGSERDGTLGTVTIFVLTGIATTGATLDNMAGAQAFAAPGTLAGTSGAGRGTPVEICDALVPATATLSSQITLRDRRPWAAGLDWYTTNNSGPNTYASSTSSAFAAVDAGLQQRVECTGKTIEAFFEGWWYNSGTSGTTARLQLRFAVDGVVAGDPGSPPIQFAQWGSALKCEHLAVLTPSAGSHLIQLQFANYDNSTNPVNVWRGGTAANNVLMRLRERMTASGGNGAS